MTLRQITSIFVCLLLLSTRIEAQCPSGSSSSGGFVYLCQPPSTTIGGCSPYQLVTNYINILLQCNVRRLNPTDSFQIRWFRERNGQVEDLGPGSYHVQISGPDDWLSRYHDTKLWVQQYRPELMGKYWCQVIKTSVTPHQPLLRSNAFTLLPPSSYTQFTCAGGAMIQTVKNATCANLPDTSSTIRVPVPSSTPVPSTTPVPSSTPQQRQVSTTPVRHTSTIIATPSPSIPPPPSPSPPPPRPEPTSSSSLAISSSILPPPPPEEVAEAATMSRVVGASVGTVLFVGAIITVVAVAAIVLTTLLMKRRAGSSKVMFDHELQSQASHDYTMNT